MSVVKSLVTGRYPPWPKMSTGQRRVARSVAALGAVRAAIGEWVDGLRLDPVLAEVRPLSQVPDYGLVDLARLVRRVVRDGVPGDLVECGVWRGGAALLMANVLGAAGARDRKVWLFDSFEGMPAPDPKDGPSALAWSTDTRDPHFFDNNRVAVEDVQRSAERLGLSARTRIVKGWFDQTLPATRTEIAAIALLRIDADWYASVKCCLENLFDLVSPGGYVVFDDYFAFDGCALAVHEFLTERQLPLRIETVKRIAVIRKPGQ